MTGESRGSLQPISRTMPPVMAMRDFLVLSSPPQVVHFIPMVATPSPATVTMMPTIIRARVAWREPGEDRVDESNHIQSLAVCFIMCSFIRDFYPGQHRGVGANERPLDLQPNAELLTRCLTPFSTTLNLWLLLFKKNTDKTSRNVESAGYICTFTVSIQHDLQ